MQTLASTPTKDHFSELLALQASYDEFVASSKEIEEELEHGLETAGEK